MRPTEQVLCQKSGVAENPGEVEVFAEVRRPDPGAELRENQL
jgi:hypothetical protein